MADILENLKDEEVNFDLVAALSSQEEVGLRGAYVTARKIKPDLCLVLESCPADDTFEPDWLSQTGLKRGPMLRDMDVTFLPNPKFQQYACDLADKTGFLTPGQSELVAGKTGRPSTTKTGPRPS